MLIETLSMDWRKACTTDQTGTTFSSGNGNLPIPQAATPTGDSGTATGGAVHNLSFGDGTNRGEYSQNFLKIIPYGVGADDTTFSMRVYGWTRFYDPVTALQIWIPINLVELACTISTVPGVAGTPIDATHFFVDLITVTTGSTLGGEAPSESIISPANNTIGTVMIDLRGSQKYSIQFSTGSSATSCNALLGLL